MLIQKEELHAYIEHFEEFIKDSPTASIFFQSSDEDFRKYVILNIAVLRKHIDFLYKNTV